MAEQTMDGIDSAVMKLMEVDAFGTPEASELSDLLSQIAEQFQAPEESRAVEALQLGIENIGKNATFGSTIQHISKTLSCLQEIVLNGKSFAEVTFPNERELASEQTSETVAEPQAAPEMGTEQVASLVDALNADDASDASQDVASRVVSTIDGIDLAVMKLMEIDNFDSADASELSALLEQMSQQFLEQNVQRPSFALLDCVNKIEEKANFGKTVQQISKTLSCLQDLKLHGKSIDDISFPNEESGNGEEQAEDIPALEESEGYEEANQLAQMLNLSDEISSEDLPKRENIELFSGDPDLLGLFVEDATDNLESVESFLLILEDNPSDPEALDAAFRSFHSVKGSAGFAQLVPIEKIAHAMESLLDLARDGKLTLRGKIMDLILGTLDVIRMWVNRVQDSVDNESPLLFTSEGTEFITEIMKVVEAGDSIDLSTIVVPGAVESDHEEEGSQSVEEAGTSAGTESNSSESTSESGTANNVKSSSAKSTEAVKVDRQRLDELIDLIGELVITESMVSAEVAEKSHSQTESNALPQLRKITRELQELSLSLRMMSIHGLFQKGKRVVRDLSRKLGKPTRLVIEGAETELDKSILDELSDPLVHLIRNSVDHGIEPTTEERVASGKEKDATVTLRAFYQGGNIYIEIEDDGRGLDRKKLFDRAVEKGIIEADAELTDEQIHHLIFAPGFSTAEQVTEVSGRGVGMDVVRRNIEALRGSVHIQSELGKGTCISLRLPLTLAIIDGMVVRVQDQRYIIPTLSIVNQIRPDENDVSTIHGSGEIIAVRGRNVPFHRLNEVFHLTGESKTLLDSTIVLIEEKDRLAGLLVDEVIGQQQVVIKSLGATLSDSSEGIAGAAVMPDGEIGLILDVHGVLELARGSSLKK